MFLGRDEVKEIRKTDKKTPLGSEVSEVVFCSPLDLLHKEMDNVRSQIEELDKEADKEKIGELEKKLEELTAEQTPDKQEERVIYASNRTLEGQTASPDDNYYHKRKIQMVEAILKILAEWNIQDRELGGVFQWTEQSYKENLLNAIGKKFGKKQIDLNVLDYHYAILGTDRTDN